MSAAAVNGCGLPSTRDRRRLGIYKAGLPFLLSGCTSIPNGFLLSPAGPIARAEQREFLIACIILFFVFAPVLVLTPVVAWHYRIANTKAAYRPQWGFSWVLEVLIWLPPTGIVILLSVVLLHYTLLLDPYRPLSNRGPPLEVQVVALDWKWLFLYPAQHIATVNQLVLPAGQSVHFFLTSGTVMQSLLMPRLAGQIFAMDGMRTQLNFAVDAPGTYYGENTQYNGDGFPEDHFTIRAVSPSQFTGWVASMQAEPARLDDSGYQTLSVQSVLSAPLQYGNFPSDLFQRILSQQIQPGYIAQHHEAAGHG